MTPRARLLASPASLLAPLLLAPLLLGLTLSACQSGGAPRESGATLESTQPKSGAAPAASASYGAPFQADAPVVPLASLLASPSEHAGKMVTTQGKVQRACSRKGCWMEIEQGDAACRVTFKDYGFFVPTDSAGSEARVQGRLDTRVVTKADVDHLEAEGARFQHKQADGSATEVRLIASAVQLTR